MKKILLALLFIPAFLSAQTTDLSKYHDSNRLWEKADDNFDINADSFAVSTDTAQAIRVDVNSNLDSIAVSTDTAQAIRSDLNELMQVPHGGYAFSDSVFEPSLSQNTWVKVTNGNNDLYTLVEADLITFGGDTVTVIINGDYMGFFTLSLSGTATDQYHAAVYKNGVITPFESHASTAANSAVVNMTIIADLHNLVTGDDISLYIRNTTNNDDPTLISGQFILTLIHPD